LPRLLLPVLLACAASSFAQSPAAVPPLDSPVVDTTGTLDAAQKRQLEQQALALQERKGSQLQVLMVSSTQPEPIEQYTQRVFDQWKLGREGVDDAVLLVVAKDDRRVRIQPGYGLEGAIPDVTAGRIIQEYMAPRFRAGDYGGGIVDATAVLVQLIDGEPLPAPIADNRASEGSVGRVGQGGRGGGGNRWTFTLIVAFVAASFVRGLFSRAPAATRGLLAGGVAGSLAWLLSSQLSMGVMMALLGFVHGVFKAPGGSYVRHGGWNRSGGSGRSGGGDWSSSSSSRSSSSSSRSSSSSSRSSGWSGGGGRSGGGGASGSW